MGRGIVLGIALTLAAQALVGLWAVETGHIPARADVPSGALERWAAHTALDATLGREAPASASPLAADEATLKAGLALYKVNCLVCHGGADAKPTDIAVGLFQPAPQLAKHGVEDDPESATAWKVTHGIRMTGMPAFGKTLSATQVSQVTAFLKHMDALPEATQAAWARTSTLTP